MKQKLLTAYLMLAGLSDSVTGVMLLFTPLSTLRLMRLTEPADTLPFLSYIGAFVLSVGIACIYGAILTRREDYPRLEVVWLLTAITRGLVAAFVTTRIITGDLQIGWASVAASDGLLALFQAIGMTKGWLRRAQP